MLVLLLLQNVFHTGQHGFLEYRSSTTFHYDLFNFVAMAADARKSLFVFYLDMTRRFDYVFYIRLLNKLMSCGVLGTILWWFISDLFNRHQVASAAG